MAAEPNMPFPINRRPDKPAQISGIRHEVPGMMWFLRTKRIANVRCGTEEFIESFDAHDEGMTSKIRLPRRR
jgi:hypothetical protein